MNAKFKMQNAKSRTGGTGKRSMKILGGRLLFGYPYEINYHKIGFCASKRLHSFCILHFEFCIHNATAKLHLKTTNKDIISQKSLSVNRLPKKEKGGTPKRHTTFLW